VYRIRTHHKNDFDEVMSIVQISIGNYEIMDVLLDGEFGINIIFEHLRRKLGLIKTLINAIHVKNGILKKSKTNKVDMKPQNRLSRCTFKISITLLQMEDTLEAYLMFLKRPWLKQVKAHHDWGNNILTIIIDTKTMTLSTEKRIMVHPSQRPCYIDDIYDWEGGLMDGDEECLYHVVLELWPVGEVSLEELKFLLKVYLGMAQPKNIINYPFWYY
jgi:predicted transport protein